MADVLAGWNDAPDNSCVGPADSALMANYIGQFTQGKTHPCCGEDGDLMG